MMRILYASGVVLAFGLVVAEDLDIAPLEQPSLKPGLDPNQVSPGAFGFIVTFILAIAVILLFADMARRQRRLKYRFDYAMQREREQAEAEEGAEGAAESAETAADEAAAEKSIAEQSNAQKSTEESSTPEQTGGAARGVGKDAQPPQA